MSLTVAVPRTDADASVCCTGGAAEAAQKGTSPGVRRQGTGLIPERGTRWLRADIEGVTTAEPVAETRAGQAVKTPTMPAARQFTAEIFD
ncbi:hypothetical protein [Cryobacterium sp. GrIS_2_6]|uniref:hypothetical protein n=1 Tax=Cryobacterium sp. GrIS_2_6 TaxID=3162785 RepID=UPI002DF8DE95|nr:hypothetical protein [Cryobacterium psychrotolerans]